MVGQGVVEVMHGVDGFLYCIGSRCFICLVAGDGEVHMGCVLLIELLPE